METSSKSTTMRALVYRGPGDIALEERSIPKAGSGEAIIRVRLTTICGTDVHIMKGEYPVDAGLIIGHEAVGTIYELGAGVTGYHVGQRVLVGAITPCGQCYDCLGGSPAQCGGKLGGWRLGNTRDGMQAHYACIPYAQANLAPIPNGITDEQALLLADVGSTGLSASESAHLSLGDSVAIFAVGPIGLAATAGAKLRGAGMIIAIDANPERLQCALKLGATHLINIREEDPVDKIAELTGSRGVDVAIEALGTQETFENAMHVLRPGGTLSSLGVYAGKLAIPEDAFAAGIGDLKIVTTLCPGGKERMRRLMELVLHHRLDLSPLITHRFKLEQIEDAYRLFSSQSDGVIKVAIDAN
jgi:alcohol dehydrogenase